MSTRPIPIPKPESEEFWRNCREGRLVLQKCTKCGQVQFYPRMWCSHCWAAELEWVEASGQGTVFSYTIVHRPPSAGFAELVPYGLVLVDLDEGVRMLGNLTGCDLKAIRVGMRVKVYFEKLSETISIPQFMPA